MHGEPPNQDNFIQRGEAKGLGEEASLMSEIIWGRDNLANAITVKIKDRQSWVLDTKIFVLVLYFSVCLNYFIRNFPKSSSVSTPSGGSSLWSSHLPGSAGGGCSGPTAGAANSNPPSNWPAPHLWSLRILENTIPPLPGPALCPASCRSGRMQSDPFHITADAGGEKWEGSCGKAGISLSLESPYLPPWWQADRGGHREQQLWIWEDTGSKAALLWNHFPLGKLLAQASVFTI